MTISYPRMDEHHAYLPHSGLALLKLPLGHPRYYQPADFLPME